MMEEQVHSSNMPDQHDTPMSRRLSVSSDESIPEELPLTVLFKFIRSFNGERSELTTFIQNANSAFSLALPHQKPPLLLYIVSQLTTNVVNELELSEVSSWEELKTKLKLYYSHTKHLAQAHEELELIKQQPHESITDFFKRVERAKADCLHAETLNCQSDAHLPGLRKAIQETALRRFIIHCKPEISQMLRARDISSLNDAYTLALQEEKIINYTKGRSQSLSYCSYCKTNTHSFQQCRKRSATNGPQRQQVNPRSPGPNSFSYYPNGNPHSRYPSYNAQSNTFSQNRRFSPDVQNRPPQPLGNTYFKRHFPDTRTSNYYPPNGNNPQHHAHSNGTNPRVNNIQSESLNSNLPPMINAPSVDTDTQVQEAFQSLHHLHL